jgi:hypothetical protein
MSNDTAIAVDVAKNVLQVGIRRFLDPRLGAAVSGRGPRSARHRAPHCACRTAAGGAGRADAPTIEAGDTFAVRPV